MKVVTQVQEETVVPYRTEQIKLPNFSHEYQYVLNHFGLCVKDSNAFDKLKKEIARVKAQAEKESAAKAQHGKEKEAKLAHFLKKAEK